MRPTWRMRVFSLHTWAATRTTASRHSRGHVCLSLKPPFAARRVHISQAASSPQDPGPRTQHRPPPLSIAALRSGGRHVYSSLCNIIVGNSNADCRQSLPFGLLTHSLTDTFTHSRCGRPPGLLAAWLRRWQDQDSTAQRNRWRRCETFNWKTFAYAQINSLSAWHRDTHTHTRTHSKTYANCM